MASEDQIVSKHLVDEIPRATGIYIFQGTPKESGEPSVLYVGKAKDLRSRVRQYFAENTSDTRAFVEFIRKRVESIRYIVVSTEQDALILENEMIKKFRPPYNIHLRDDKRYLSLRLDLKHEWPKIDVVRKIRKDGAIYLGPFSSSGRLRMTLDFMQKIFPLRTCTDHKLYNRSRPCIEYEIKRCVAPCVNYVTREAYQELVNAAVLFLKGKNVELKEKLETEMQRAAEEERYEVAAELRNRIEAIASTTASQAVVGHSQLQQGIDQDVIGLHCEENRAAVVIIFIRNGVIFDQRTFEFKNTKLDQETLLHEFLERYYSGEVYMPHEILIPFSIDTSELLISAKILIPRVEDKKKFLEMAQGNAKVFLQAKLQKSKRLEKTLANLQTALTLKNYPQTMDCMDISHHQGAETVASVVRFRDGVPEKDFYRRLKMKIDQVDDFESMREAVDRRYKTPEDLPALLVIDGGKGQLQSAVTVLTEKGWLERLDLVSLAKAREDEGVDPLNPQNRERIFKPNQKNPILLKADSAEELLLRFLRDEAHRFAITYHRLRKEKSASASILDTVEGMTARIKLKLLRRFGSVEGVHDASDFDLLQEIPNRLLEPIRLTLAKALSDKE